MAQTRRFHRRHFDFALLAACVIGSLLAGSAVTGSAWPDRVGGTGSAKAKAAADYGRLPVAFAPNHGQAPEDVGYVADGGLALGPTGAHLGSLGMRLVGSDPSDRPVSSDPLPGTVKILHGQDPAGWRTNLPTFATAG